MRTVLTAVLIAGAAGALLMGQSRTAAQTALDEAVYVEVVKGDLGRAVQMYEQVTKQFASDEGIVAKAQLRIADARGEINRRAAGRPRATAEQVVFDHGSGRPSPDGRYLPWVTRGRLVLRDLDTGADRDVTSPSSLTEPEDPFFTADSQHLIYDWFDGPSDTFQLRIVDVDGRNDRVLVPDFGTRGPGTASPDRRLIAVPIRKAGVDQISLIDLRTAKPTIMRSLEWRAPQIGNFSPDGRFLVYSVAARQESLDRHIYVLAVDGSTEYPLVTSAGVNQDPFFAPDGRHVVFSSNRSGGRWDLMSVPVENGKATSEPRRLKADTGSFTLLGFSATGDLFYRRTLDERDAYEVNVDPATWRAIGLPTRLSERFVGASFAPRLSADGSSLAYAALRGYSSIYQAASMAIVVRRAGTTVEQSLNVPLSPAPADAFPNSIQWFPDKKSLLLTEYGQPGRQFHRLDLATGQLTLLFTARQSTLSSIVTPDGTAVLYPLTDSDDPSTDADERTNKHLIRHDLVTGDEQTVLQARAGGNGSAAFHGLSASADGKRVAYLVADAVWVATLATGETHVVAQIPGIQLFSTVWDPSGRGILVNVNGVGGATEIWYVPLDGALPHPTGVSLPLARVSSVQPDGRRVTFSAGTSRTEAVRIGNLDLSLGAAK